VQYRTLKLGADISTMAVTKYLSGHSDVMMGTVATTREAWQPLNERCDAFGMTVSPDDAWLVLRGMRTLSARLQLHERHALEVAHWLQARPEVAFRDALTSALTQDHPRARPLTPAAVDQMSLDHTGLHLLHRWFGFVSKLQHRCFHRRSHQDVFGNPVLDLMLHNREQHPRFVT